MTAPGPETGRGSLGGGSPVTMNRCDHPVALGRKCLGGGGRLKGVGYVKRAVLFWGGGGDEGAA